MGEKFSGRKGVRLGSIMEDVRVEVAREGEDMEG